MLYKAGPILNMHTDHVSSDRQIRSLVKHSI